MIAAINADVKEIIRQKTREWRQRQARLILERAITDWRKAGLTGCPTTKAISLAALPEATPARVDYLVTYANDLISAGKPTNPIAVVIHGLGASERSRRKGPMDPPLVVVQRWQQAEANAVRALETQASINSRLSSLTHPASSDQAHVRPGGTRA